MLHVTGFFKDVKMFPFCVWNSHWTCRLIHCSSPAVLDIVKMWMAVIVVSSALSARIALICNCAVELIVLVYMLQFVAEMRDSAVSRLLPQPLPSCKVCSCFGCKWLPALWILTQNKQFWSMILCGLLQLFAFQMDLYTVITTSFWRNRKDKLKDGLFPT